jgi:quinol monooxygenase YgiN
MNQTRSIVRAAFWMAAFFAASAAPVHAQAPSQAPVGVSPTHPNGEVSIVIDYEVKQGFEADFEQHFKRLVECARLDPGNITFDVAKVIGAQRRYVSYAIWRSPAALDSHLKRPYAKALFAMFDRALERPITQGGRRMISDLSPATRPAPVRGDLSDRAECR